MKDIHKTPVEIQTKLNIDSALANLNNAKRTDLAAIGALIALGDEDLVCELAKFTRYE